MYLQIYRSVTRCKENWILHILCILGWYLHINISDQVNQQALYTIAMMAKIWWGDCVSMCVCVYVRACVRVCVCVCVREREGGRAREQSAVREEHRCYNPLWATYIYIKLQNLFYFLHRIWRLTCLPVLWEICLERADVGACGAIQSRFRTPLGPRLLYIIITREYIVSGRWVHSEWHT